MDFGILARPYRVGYFGPKNQALLENIVNLHAEEYAQHDETGKILRNRCPINIEFIDLSDPSKFDEFQYQCDIIVYDTHLLVNGTEEEKNQAQEALDNIIEANKNIYDKSTGRLKHNSARIISIYHGSDFPSKEARKEFLNGKSDENGNKLTEGYKENFSEFDSAPCIEIDEESLVSDLLPDFIADHMQYVRLELELSKEKDPTKLISKFAAMICIAFDNKNPYTKGHSERVGLLTRQLAETLRFKSKEEFETMYPDTDFDKVCVKAPEDNRDNLYALSKEYIELLAAMAMAHDIGKIAIPNHIIDKKEKLSDSEFEIMRAHAAIGGRFVAELATEYPQLKDLKDVAESHHEFFNGSEKGYPNRKSGYKIPITARMTCIADSFDAMTTSRSYNEPKTFEEAIIEIAACAGTQFDPDLAYFYTKSLCMPHAITNEDNKTEMVPSYIASKEGFAEGMAHFHYDYSNPPTSDGGKDPKIPNRNYEPNYTAIQTFANKYLQSKETYMQFVNEIQNNDLNQKRDDGVFSILKKIADIKGKLSEEKGKIDSVTRSKLTKEFEHYHKMRAKSAISILTQGLTQEAVKPLETPPPDFDEVGF